MINIRNDYVTSEGPALYEEPRNATAFTDPCICDKISILKTGYVL